MKRPNVALVQHRVIAPIFDRLDLWHLVHEPEQGIQRITEARSHRVLE